MFKESQGDLFRKLLKLENQDFSESSNKRIRNHSGHVLFLNNYYDRKTEHFLGWYILVTKEFNDKWSIPGGRCNSNESRIHAAEREVLEEIKINIRIKKQNIIGVNGSAVFVVDGTSMSRKVINHLIRNETRREFHFNEIKEVGWLRVDSDYLELMDVPSCNENDFTEFALLALDSLKKHILNGRRFD